MGLMGKWTEWSQWEMGAGLARIYLPSLVLCDFFFPLA
jgi:hypothetical protein